MSNTGLQPARMLLASANRHPGSTARNTVRSETVPLGGLHVVLCALLICWMSAHSGLSSSTLILSVTCAEPPTHVVDELANNEDDIAWDEPGDTQ